MAQQVARNPNRTIIFGVLIVILMIGAVIFGVYLSQKGFVSLFSGNNVHSNQPRQVDYDDVPNFVGELIKVNGYIIIPHSDTICFGGWSTCKLWLDDDPALEGVGNNEIEIKVGNGANQITVTGALRGNTGQTVHLTENQSFNWYHVTIIGTVSGCKNGSCVIDVEQVRGLQ
jgi:hypothetical protein